MTPQLALSPLPTPFSPLPPTIVIAIETRRIRLPSRPKRTMELATRGAAVHVLSRATWSLHPSSTAPPLLDDLESVSPLLNLSRLLLLNQLLTATLLFLHRLIHTPMLPRMLAPLPASSSLTRRPRRRSSTKTKKRPYVVIIHTLYTHRSDSLLKPTSDKNNPRPSTQYGHHNVQ